MIYKGKFTFGKCIHPGECEIDGKNNIHITINESFIDDFRKKIKGIANGKHLSAYCCIPCGNDIGFYRFQVGYFVVGVNINYGKVDLNKHIQDFRFTFSPLDEWLGFNPLNREENNIRIIVPNDIGLFKNEELEIKISFFEENNNISENEIRNLKIVPYICVTSKKEMSFEKITEYVQIIARFFATMIGFSGNVNVIKFHSYYNGKQIFPSIENELIINTDFSNLYSNNKAYTTYNLRTYYNDFSQPLDILFNKWFTVYKKYREALTWYFSPYNDSTIENHFLNIVKCLEKISLEKEDKREKVKKNKRLRMILNNFYDMYKTNLISEMKKYDFDKKYIRNIKEIHNQVANSIVYEYNDRIKLSDRIKKIDKRRELVKHFKDYHTNSFNEGNQIYDYIANTRHYYTHLGDSKFIVKVDYLPGYCRILEKMFVKEILMLIINDEKFVDVTLNKDRYLTIYDNRDI